VKELRVTGEVVEDTSYPDLYSFDHVVEHMIPENDGKLDKPAGFRDFKIRLYINYEEFYIFVKRQLISRSIIPLKENSATLFSKNKDHVEINSHLKGGVQ